MRMRRKDRFTFLALLMVVIVALPIFVGCDKENETEPITVVGGGPKRGEKSPGLILVHCECKGLSNIDDPYFVWDYRMIPLRAQASWYFHGINQNSYNDFNNLFQYLERINNDNTFFYKKDEIQGYDSISYNTNFIMALFEDFTDARVEALSDFDADHPAGSNLTEMAYLSYMSVYPYIREGYKLNENSIGNGPYKGIAEYEAEYRQHPGNSEAIDSTLSTYRLNFMPGFRYGVRDVFFNKKLSDIASDNLKLVHPVGLMYLSFTKKPAQTCKVRLSIDLHLRESSCPTRTVSVEMLIK